MKLLTYLFIFFFACLSLPALQAQQTLEYTGTLSPDEMRALQSQEKMMCTAMPPLVVLNCRADDRDNPNGAQVGRLEWRVEGGMNPFTVQMIHSSGQTFTVIGGTGPGNNQFNAPRDFSLTNTTTSATCIPGGDYTIQITDAEGCVVTCMITFNPTCSNYDNSINPIVTHVDCNNPTGSITIGNIPDAYCNTDPSAGSVNYAWSDGGPSVPNRMGLAPGFYSVTVTDFYGCTGEFNNIEVEDNSSFEIFNCSASSPILVGGNGEISFEISGGTPPFDISWDGVNFGGPIPGNLGFNTISGLPPGAYTIEVEDSNGCQAECLVIIEDAVCTLEVTCPAGPNADNTVTISYSGGVGFYNIFYTSPSGVSGDQFTNLPTYTSPVLPTGDYIFEITDDNGSNCAVYCNITISAPDCSTLSLSNSQVNQPACNTSLGSIDLTVTGGNPAYTFSWTGPNGYTATTEDINNLAPGTYTLTISDAASCTTIPPASFTITAPDALVIDCSATSSDFEANNGSISVDIMGGTPPYRLSYNATLVDPYTSNTPINNLAPNTYNIVVTDANGCTQNCMVIVEEINCDLDVTPTITQPICPGDANGSISLMLANVVGDSSIVWSVPGFDNQTSLSNLSAGNYYAVVGDDNCTLDTLRFTLSDPAAVEVSITLEASINCFGDSTASLLASVTEGVAPFSYNWIGANQPDTNSIDSLTAGQYILEVTDGSGCLGRDTFQIVQPEDLIFSCSATAESSSGANDGSITLNFSQMGNSTGPYSISGDYTASGLSLADSPIVISSLAPGTYNFIFTDSNGCEEMCSVSVNAGGCIMTLDGQISQPDCNTPLLGSLVVTPVNGTPPYTYAWTGSSSTDSLVNDLPPGNYSVLVTDANACTASQDFSLIAFTAFPSWTIQAADSLCRDACATYLVNLDGQSPFVLDYQVSNQMGLLNSGNFPVQTDADTLLQICPADLGLSSLEGLTIAFTQLTDGQCNSSDTLSFPIQIYPLATDTIRQNFCTGDTPSFGGQSFDEANPYAEILFAAQSVNGCDSLLVVDLSFFDAVPGSVDTTICLGSSITLEGQVFDANNNGSSFTSASPSALGCDSVVTVNISFFPAAIRNIDTTICEGSSLVLEGNIFNAANPSGSFTSNTPSANGCDSLVDVTLSFFPVPMGSLDTTICSGSSLTLLGQTFDEANPTGTLTLANASANGCDSLVNVTLSFFPVPMGSLDTTICSGSSLTLLGQTFDEANPTGTLTLPAASANGCDSLVNVIVNFSAPLVLELLGIRGNCNDTNFSLEFSYSGTGDVEVNISNAVPATFVLSPGMNTMEITPTANTISILSATSLSDNCPVSSSGSVNIPLPPVLSIDVLSGADASSAISCFGANDGQLRAVLAGNNLEGFSFLWSHGSTSAITNNLGAGTYTVTASHPNGCTVSSSITLSEPPALSFLASPQAASCLDDLAALTIDTVLQGNGPYVYQINQGGYFPIGRFPFRIQQAPGSIRLDIQDSNGCSASEELLLEAAPVQQLLILPGDTLIRLGDSLLLTAQTNLDPTLVRWSPSSDTSGLQSLSLRVGPTDNTSYRLFVADENGCTATAEVLIRVDRRVPVYAPNAFSPNGDGQNDLFTFYGERGIVRYHDLVIFNRWGEVVHRANGDLPPNDPSWAWDGTHRGELLNPGVFVYQIYITLADGRKERLQGEVILLR